MAAEERRNRNEQIKEALDPLDLRPRIDRYAREGLAAIDPDDLTIRFRWTVISKVPAILDELDRIGLSSLQACGDTVRNVLGCPVAGVDAGEWFDATPDLLAVEARMARTKEFSNLPRKFKQSVSGCRHRCAQPEVNDVALVGHVHPDGRQGFDLLVGGGLSSSPRFADRLGVFVPRAEAPEVAAAVAAAYRDHVGVHRQRDGRNYIGVAPLVGRTDGDTLVAVAELARELGGGRVRLTTQQKLVVLDVPDERVDEAVARLDALDLPAFPSQFHRGAMACTGLAFGHRVRERVPATDTGAVVRGLVAGYLAERQDGESVQSWLRRQPPATLAALSRPAGGAGEPNGIPAGVAGGA